MMKRFFWGMVLLGLLAGCGRQDRYEIVAAPYFTIDTNAPPWGLEEIVCPHLSGSIEGTIVIDDVFYSLDGTRRVLRTDGNSYTCLPPLPDGNGSLDRIIADPAGGFWALSIFDRKLNHYHAGTWTMESMPILDNGLQELLVDAQGRLLACSQGAGLWRRESAGEWTQQVAAMDPAIMIAWQSAPGQDPVLLGPSLELIAWNGEAWEVGPPFLAEPGEYFRSFAGDGAGHFVVEFGSPARNLLGGGEGWEEIPNPSQLRGFFWWEGQLLAYDKRAGDLKMWDGESWTLHTTLDLDGGNTHRSMRALPGPAGVHLLFGGSESWFLDASGLTQTLPYLSNIVGFLLFEDSRFLMARTGQLLEEDEGTWSVVAEIPDPDQDLVYYNRTLFPDPNGGILILGREQSYRWTRTEGFVALDQANGISACFPQPDGRLLMIGSQEVWVYGPGEFRKLPGEAFSSSSVCGAQLDDQGRVWLAHRDFLEVLEDGVARVVLVYDGWDARGLANLPGRGLYLFGNDHLFSVQADAFEDLTPLWDDDGDLVPADVAALMDDDLGGILALDMSGHSILRLVDDTWQVVEPNAWRDLGRPVFLDRTPEGTLYVHDGPVAGILEVAP